jgi:two-component system, NtrC family, response regulator GlrR
VTTYPLEPAGPRARPRLSWTDADGRHARSIHEATTLGSAPAAGVVVVDRAVSRLHAELVPAADGLWVRDVGSRNGTYVDDVRVVHARVPNGSIVRVGASTILVTYDPAEAPRALWNAPVFGRMIGRSAVMRELFASLAKIARTESSVVIWGETGTGKELIAEAIHGHSPRAAGPFVVMDCASVPEHLIESELFGHARGAFTGAAAARSGAFEAADGGTIFLDEVGELPLALQPKLLRVLESRAVRRVGEVQHRPVNLRVISATHRDLRSMVNRGAFREDLYFRLCVLPVLAPPLRDRPCDIAPLMEHFLAGFGGRAIPPAAMRAIVERPWPGNVRELRNFAERVAAVGIERALEMAEAIPRPPVAEAPAGEVPRAAPPAAFPAVPPAWLAHGFKEFRDKWLAAGEREYLQRVLARHRGNIPAAAAEAQLERTYMYRLTKRHDL